MVSKTFVCLALLAMVVVCSCKPFVSSRSEKRLQHQQENNERITCPDLNSDSDSNESIQGPCDLTNEKLQKTKKNLQVQDTSSGENDELEGRKMKVFISQEDKNNSREIRRGPSHQPINHGRSGPDYQHGQQMRENIQKSRKENGDGNSNENNSQVDQNQINRQKQW